MPLTTINGTTESLADEDFKESRQRDVKDYLTWSTKAEALRQREAIGRERAKERGTVWPIPGTPIGRGPHGDGRTWWAENIEELADGRWAMIKSARVAAMVGKEQTTDGTKPL